MARILRADQIPESAAPAEVFAAGVILEEFDEIGASDNGALNGANSTSARTPEEALSQDIVKAAELQAEEILARARREADRCVEAAKAEAQEKSERVREQMQEKVEQAFQNARSEGYQKGFSQGEQTAIQETKAEFDQLLQTLQRAVSDTEPFKEKLIAQSEAEILELVLVISTKIVGFELSIRPQLILDVVKHGIELLKNKQEMLIRVSPGDIKTVRKYRPELLEQIEGINQIYITGDENLIAGECLIETKSNLVDSTWRRKISAAAEMVWNLYNNTADKANAHTTGEMVN